MTEIVADRVEVLKRRLEEPGVADALGQLLDHADLLALLVSGLDGLIRRSETVGDSVTLGLRELRELSPAFDVDLGQIASALTLLGGTVVDQAPALVRLMRSDLVSPEAVDVIDAASRSLVAARQKAVASDVSISGVIALVRALKDPDVARALGFLVEVARGLGKELRVSARPNS